MKYLMTLLMIVVSIGTTIAQSGRAIRMAVSQNNRSTEMEGLQQRVEAAENSFQNYIDSERRLRNDNNLKIKHENVTNALKSIIRLQQDQITEYEEELSVYRFFSNTEQTIFADTTLEHNGWSKKLSGTYQTQYNAISSIREVSLAIFEVENTISQKIGQQQEMGWNDEELQTAVALEIGKTVKTTIAKQLDDISNMDLSFLSPAQKEYYNQLLVRYNNIYNEYF